MSEHGHAVATHTRGRSLRSGAACRIRSINLNTKMGLLVESEELAEQVAASIENDVAGENSWQVRLTEEGSLEWVTVQDGAVTFRTKTEPQTSPWRRAEAWLLEAIPDDSQL